MKIHYLWVVLGLLLLPVVPSAAQAEPASTQADPIAYAVFFYSPTCPHCHEVINTHLPQFDDEFGDQLMMLFVDVTTEGGSMLFNATCTALDTSGRCGGVPMMAVGNQLLIGAVQIPQAFPGIVRAGLSTGGIGLPPVPMLREAYAASQASAADDTSAESRAVMTESVEQTVWDRFGADPLANMLATFTLFCLMGSLFIVSVYGKGERIPEQLYTWGPRAVAAGGGLLAASLIFAGGDDTFALVVAGGVVLLFAVVGWMLMNSTGSRWMVPTVAIAGLLVAAYLFQIESTGNDATCGAIGNCNAVQQSEYASILGVPIGLIGVVGYSIILLVWGVDHFTTSTQIHTYARSSLFAFAIAGTVFSAYLTFLEPFVIGATCAWCLTSALTMLLLLWLLVDDGWQAWLTLSQAQKMKIR